MLPNLIERPQEPTASTGPQPLATFKTTDRYTQLAKEFAAIDVSGDQRISYQELSNFLKQRSHKKFDEELLLALFNQMDRDRDSEITLDEFIDAFIQAEAQIQARITQLQKQIQRARAELEKSRRAAIEAEASELINAYGIKEDSVLTVKIIGANNLDPNRSGSRTPRFKLLIDKQEVLSEHAQEPVNPQWNASYTFKITKGTEELIFELYDYEFLMADRFLGQVKMPLSLIRDQLKHSDEFRLIGKKQNELVRGSVKMELQ